jgi:hypothetical protein
MIDGAHVYGVAAEDRPLIAAFMKGVSRTRALKFDHPGLGTTATRDGGRLVLQNDIGLTDAHVLVVRVEGRRVTLTYTDVHIERLVFFQNLFERFGVSWADTVSRRATGLEEDLYHLSVGTYEAPDPAALLTYLTFLGSRLVFLIDWNRARKRLRKFAPRRVCLEVLRWAADHELGHRGFLALGGEQLIFDALQSAGRAAVVRGRDFRQSPPYTVCGLPQPLAGLRVEPPAVPAKFGDGVFPGVAEPYLPGVACLLVGLSVFVIIRRQRAKPVKALPKEASEGHDRLLKRSGCRMQAAPGGLSFRQPLRDASCHAGPPAAPVRRKLDRQRAGGSILKVVSFVEDDPAGQLLDGTGGEPERVIHDHQFRAAGESAGALKQARHRTRHVRSLTHGFLEGTEETSEIGTVRRGHPGRGEIAEVAEEHVFPSAGVLAFTGDAPRKPADQACQEEALTADRSALLPIRQPPELLGPPGVECLEVEVVPSALEHDGPDGSHGPFQRGQVFLNELLLQEVRVGGQHHRLTGLHARTS